MDRHNYVKVVVHGFKAVSTEERLMTYCDSSKVGTSFTGNEYQAMDTLFALAEAYLFCQLVEMKDLVMIDEKKKKNKEYEKLTNVSYHQMFDEIRKSVDLCHRDGSLKTEVAKDPAKYIVPDESLKELLTTLKTSGRSVFLLTNSLFDYTNVVMNFLISGKTGEEKNLDWLEYFDSVFVGSMKPNFFTQDNNIIFEVDAKTYMLKNTDSGGPLTPIGGSDIDHVSAPSSSKPGDGENTYDSKVYQGGSYVHLMDSLGISRGSDVLYVGDHIFGDILRSKKTLGWRTMLIVPEMDHELEVLEETREEGVLDELKQLRERRDELDYKLQKIIFEEKRQKEKKKMAKTSEEMKMVEQLEKDFETAKLEHRKKTKEYHERFHWVWGALMKSGYQNSRFAHQVERYACVYTSKVSNMLRYSPEASFRAFSDTMPHDDSSP
jgi:HAD superfamily 5'-nucleotidase-like hydrolase